MQNRFDPIHLHSDALSAQVLPFGATLADLRFAGTTRNLVLGFDGESPDVLDEALGKLPPGPVVLTLGAEGPGLRDRTRDTCDMLVRIDPARGFGSLNVSNAAAVGLYAARHAAAAITNS